MIGITLCVVVSILQVVLSGEMPPHCRGPPPGVDNPKDCCKLQKIFSEEDFEACGIEKPDETKPRQLPDCSKQICLLNRYGLMKDETTVDKDAVAAFLDKFAEENADYETAVKAAKEVCLKNDLPGPPTDCEINKIVFCISGTIFMNCPKWEDTDNCKKLKNHLEECKKYIK